MTAVEIALAFTVFIALCWMGWTTFVLSEVCKWIAEQEENE